MNQMSQMGIPERVYYGWNFFIRERALTKQESKLLESMPPLNESRLYDILNEADVQLDASVNYNHNAPDNPSSIRIGKFHDYKPTDKNDLGIIDQFPHEQKLYRLPKKVTKALRGYLVEVVNEFLPGSSKLRVSPMLGNREYVKYFWIDNGQTEITWRDRIFTQIEDGPSNLTPIGFPLSSSEQKHLVKKQIGNIPLDPLLVAYAMRINQYRQI